jgi:hypothetical protein
LILALAAVGSHYLDIEDSRVYSAAMHEFLRRAIQGVVSASSTFSFKIQPIEPKCRQKVMMRVRSQMC